MGKLLRVKSCNKRGGMFTRRIWFVRPCAIFLLIACAVTTQAGPDEEAAGAIRKIYDRMSAAVNSKDVETLFSFYTRDYISVDEKGEKKSLEEVRQETSEEFADRSIKFLRYIETIEKIIVSGDTAIVFTRTTTTIVGVHRQTGAPITVVINDRDKNSWIKINGGWLIKTGEVLGSEVTLNGSPVSEDSQIKK